MVTVMAFGRSAIELTGIPGCTLKGQQGLCSLTGIERSGATICSTVHTVVLKCN